MKPSTSFTTSLSIRVQGAVPIYTDEPDDPLPRPSTDLPQQPIPTGTKRAPRKSKTDALVALHTHARSLSIGQDDSGFHDTENNLSHTNPPISVSSSLDLSSVKTPRRTPVPPRTTPRPFDLQDCPVFFPTMEEFKDPMAYIRSISPRAINFGLCKIVPPQEWQMPFVTDTQVGFTCLRSPSQTLTVLLLFRLSASKPVFSSSTPSRPPLVLK
jgi:[histone H3]-trimethyl-L-lysine4 demethylase